MNALSGFQGKKGNHLRLSLSGFLLVLIVLLPLASCAPPVQDGGGNVRIVLGGSDARLAAREEDLTEFIYKLDFSGPGGERHVETSQGQVSVTLNLEPGEWTVHVDAWLGVEIFGSGDARFPVHAGRGNTVTIAMHPDGANYFLGKYTVTFYPNDGSPEPVQQTVTEGARAAAPAVMTWIPSEDGLYKDTVVEGWYTDPVFTPGSQYDFTDAVTEDLVLYAKWTNTSAIYISDQTGNNTLEKALAYIKTQTLAVLTNYTILLDGDCLMTGVNSANINAANAVITLLGKTATEISLSSIGSLFRISAGELVLGNNITLRGDFPGNNSALVYLQGASLRMKAGAKISDNTTSGSGGGVSVNGGSFTMEGGEISGNSAVGGGGVYVSYGDFIMEGGEISGNSATSNGGGVFTNGSFDMQGGVISGNTSSVGGGVYVGYGSFSKTGGGTIYGDTDNSHVTGDIENTAASGSGHAVYAGSSKYRNTTLGAGVGISTENTGTGSGWEE